MTGTRFTHLDGSCSEGTDIALILEPPFEAGGASDEEWELVEQLVEAEVTGVPGDWFFTTRETVEAHAEQCIQIYTRAPGREQA